jgi:predicted nuclease of predicted toxin-antitoxin system
LSLRLYADECVDMRIVAGLRRRGIDISTAREAQLLGATDERHLEYAHAHGRCVVTNDADFLRMAHDLVEQGKHHVGLLFILAGTEIGDAIRAIALVAAIFEPDEMQDWIEWIS